jgi:hypothetical protein
MEPYLLRFFYLKELLIKTWKLKYKKPDATKCSHLGEISPNLVTLPVSNSESSNSKVTRRQRVASISLARCCIGREKIDGRKRASLSAYKANVEASAAFLFRESLTPSKQRTEKNSVCTVQRFN